MSRAYEGQIKRLSQVGSNSTLLHFLWFGEVISSSCCSMDKQRLQDHERALENQKVSCSLPLKKVEWKYEIWYATISYLPHFQCDTCCYEFMQIELVSQGRLRAMPRFQAEAGLTLKPWRYVSRKSPNQMAYHTEINSIVRDKNAV